MPLEHDVLVRYVKAAARSVGRSPAFSVSVILTIALALGVNVTMFALVNAMWLRPLPVANPDTVGIILSERGTAGASALGEQFSARQITPFRSASTLSGIASELIARGITAEFIPHVVAPSGALLESTAVSSNYFAILEYPSKAAGSRRPMIGPGRCRPSSSATGFGNDSSEPILGY